MEIYSLSAINTGDFDISTGAQDTFEEILQDHGFVRPSGAGTATRGWMHAKLKLGFEVVSSTLLDGMAERERTTLLDFAPDGEVAVLSVEDIIADRMGQFASETAKEMGEQSRQLFILHNEADLDYMDARMKFESGGDYGIADLKK